MSRFLESTNLYSVKNIEKLHKICSPFFNLTSVNYFFHQFVTNEGLYCCIGTHIDLMLHFFDNDMQLSTPFITQFAPIRSGIYFMDSVNHQKFQTDMQIIQGKFQTKHSFSVTKNDGVCCRQYGFGIPPDRKDLEYLLVNELPLLNRFICYFEDEMFNVLQEMHHNPINLKKELGSLFGQEISMIPVIQLESSKKIKFFKQIGKHKNLSLLKLNLTPREIECLRYYFQGKTAREIGIFLKLSSRTIEHYMDKIKDKLLCNNRSELFTRLQQMKELNIYPEIFV